MKNYIGSKEEKSRFPFLVCCKSANVSCHSIGIIRLTRKEMTDIIDIIKILIRSLRSGIYNSSLMYKERKLAENVIVENVFEYEVSLVT